MKIDSFEPQSPFKPSLWSQAWPLLQPGRVMETMVLAHGTETSPAHCCKETTNSPSHQPS